ncbi:MAG: addiction module antidote protein, partial [Blastocatellia bacterium]
IGGSRNISRLDADVTRRIDRMVERELSILVGDASGADKAVQTYLSERQYPNVVVFCTGGECRNNVAEWPVTSVPQPHHTRDFQFFTAKDSAMAREADVGLMLWDGQSCGTIVNVARMVAANKPVVVYVPARKDFSTVRSHSDLESLLFRCTPNVRQHINEYILKYAGEVA